MASRTINIQVGRVPRAYVRDVADSVPLADSRTATLTTAPPAGPTLWGFAPAGNGTVAARFGEVNPKMGPCGIYRYFVPSGTLPFPISGIPSSIPICYSWKPNHNTMLAGGYNALMDDFFGRVTNYLNQPGTPNQFLWCSYQHEVERPDRSHTAAQARDCNDLASARCKAHGDPRIKTIQIFGGGAIQGSYTTVWPPYLGDPSVTDLYGWDPYRSNRKNANSSISYNYARGVHSWLRQNLGITNSRISVPETGLGVNDDGNATLQHKINWLTGDLQAFKDDQIHSVMYFENGLPGHGDSSIRDNPTLLNIWLSISEVKG